MSFHENWRNQSELVLSVFSKPHGESFFKKIDFFGFGIGLLVIPTGKPILPIGLPVQILTIVGRPIYRSYRLIYRFLISQI
jgi:hypothetical protein